MVSRNTPLRVLSGLIRNRNGSITFERAAIALLALMLLFWLVAIVIVLWAAIYIFTAIAGFLFVRGEGRDIRGEGPLVRRLNIRRLGARAIDYAVIALPVVIVGSIVEHLFTLEILYSTPGIVLVGGLLYFPVMNAMTDGQSVGKALLGLEVVSTVDKRSMVQFVLREIIFVLLTAMLLFPLIVYVMMKNKECESPGDVVADTRVITSQSSGIAGFAAMYRRKQLDVPPIRDGLFDYIPTRGSGGGAETQLQDDQDATTLQTNAATSGGNQTQQGGATNTGQATGNSGTEVWDEGSCPVCGNAHPPQAAFCPECGADLSQ